MGEIEIAASKDQRMHSSLDTWIEGRESFIGRWLMLGAAVTEFRFAYENFKRRIGGAATILAASLPPSCQGDDGKKRGR
jgi:hypothetical protein